MHSNMLNADQSKFDDMVDILYAGGGLIAASPHVAYHFVQNEIVIFVNRMNKLNSNFEGYYKLTHWLENLKKKY